MVDREFLEGAGLAKALEVTVNGRHSQTVGLGHRLGVVHVIVEIHGGIPNLIMRGWDAVSGDEFRWNAPQLAVGDEIRVNIVEDGQPSPSISGNTKPSLGGPDC
jgi:hypothetical protein